jgi:hypothetical protein
MVRRRALALALAATLLSTSGCKGLRSSGGDAGAGGGFFSTLASLVGFEGEIDLAIVMPGLSGSAITTTLKLKGKKMRMDYGGSGALAAMSMGIIYDGETKKSYTLMPASHTYTETDLSKLPASTPPPAGPKPVAKKTGTTDKIAGYECENWIVATPGSPNANELCVAHGLTFYAMGFGPFASFGSGDTWGGALDGGGFPLRMRMLDASGKETMRMEATRIERKSEPDSEFEVPKGFTKTGGYGGPGGYGPGGGPGGGP